MAVSFAVPGCSNAGFSKQNKRPNIILCMTDDQGWGDTGYNGNQYVKTPNLDLMAKTGVRFDRFYSAAPVCSPTRGSCITGRHPYRYGIFFANAGHMKKEEMTLAEVLKPLGYTTGHFGKWHMGTLTTKIKDANRGKPGDASHYSPPWENGFDTCFSTESKVPTYDPMKNPEEPEKPYGTYYWQGPDQMVKENLDGDDSRIIMDRAIPFMQKAAKNNQPFFMVIWFHSPHLPVVAGAQYHQMYKDLPEHGRNFFGCITAMDKQMGRLRTELENSDVANDTMLFFCSDNGPEGKKYDLENAAGSAKNLRGRKRSLYEGGIRVPGIMLWPAKISSSMIIDTPCGTVDYFPTVMDALGYTLNNDPGPIDGQSLLPFIYGKTKLRTAPLCFQSQKQLALTDNRLKLYSKDGGKTYELYDIVKDPAEATDISADFPEEKARYIQQLNQWQQSCKASLDGRDYLEQ
ncbi:MAG: sulfatase-like hydrolase/transferase [Phycisphaerae bacterium]|nr:sulfatase-like hydrolase/transferase [Phycisphaerae bacterium]